MVVTILLQAILWIWFLGCITTYKFGKYTLVEGMGVKSAEFVMLCLYSVGLILYYILQPAGKWMLLAIMIFWLVVQFFCHWYYSFILILCRFAGKIKSPRTFKAQGELKSVLPPEFGNSPALCEAAKPLPL